MYHTHKSLYDRSLEKTPEQVFINSLRKEFELSPAESAGVLELAKSCLFGEVPHTLGKLKFLCASQKAKHGKPLREQDLIRVTLTLDNGIEDLDVLKNPGQRRFKAVKDPSINRGGLFSGRFTDPGGSGQTAAGFKPYDPYGYNGTDQRWQYGSYPWL